MLSGPTVGKSDSQTRFRLSLPTSVRVLFVRRSPSPPSEGPACQVRTLEGRACHVRAMAFDNPLRFDGHDKHAPPRGHDKRVPPNGGETCLAGPVHSGRPIVGTVRHSIDR